MRLLAAALLFTLSTSSAIAQHVSTTENRYASLGGGYAIVATGSGAVIAWRGVDATTGQLALHAGSIDRNGALRSSAIIDVPNAAAFAPALARAGNAILLAFIHRDTLRGDEVAAVPLDEEGHVNGAMHLYGIATSAAAPPLVASGANFTLWDARFRYSLDATGNVLSQVSAQPPMRVLGIEGGELRFASTSLPERFHCGFSMCGTVPAYYLLSWNYTTPSIAKTGSLQRNWYIPGTPAAAGTAAEIALVWNGFKGVEVLFLHNGAVAAELLIPGSADPGSTPAVAFDGARYLVVFEDFGNVYGALIDSNSSIGHRFPIATGPLSEDQVNVAALSHGRFLVTYRNHDTLAGRIVTTDDEAPAKRRSVR